MKKLCRMKSMMLFVIISTSIMSMETLQKNNGVKFEGGIVIPHHSLAQIRAALFHYQKYKINFDSRITVPNFPKVSSQALKLVKDALNIEMNQFVEVDDKKVSLFADYYKNKLSEGEKDDLINASGLLHIPVLIAQLIKVVFPGDIYNKIAAYFEKERSSVGNFFKSQLINNKLPLINTGRFKIDLLDPNPLCAEIDHRSVWMKYDYVTSYQNDPIPLYINNIMHDTYATYFATETYEYRITNKKDNTCILWVIDHDNLKNLNYTFSTPIKHQKPIKGSCFARMKTGQDYVVTFSESDIAIIKIGREVDNNSAVVDIISKTFPQDCQIIDVCIDFGENYLVVGAHEKHTSVIHIVSMDGNFLKKSDTFSFKKFGLLEKVFIYRDDYGDFNLLFCVGNDYRINKVKFDKNQNQYFYQMPERCFVHSDIITTYHSSDGYNIYKNKDSLLICDRNNSDSVSIEEDSLNVPWHVYSPDGKYLLCNFFRKKLGFYYIETILRDSITHEILYFTDNFPTQTLSFGVFSYAGVGFSRDGKNLVFVGAKYSPSVINRVLLPDSNDNNILEKLKEMMSSDIGMTLLFNQLCANVKKYKILDLNAQDPTRKMLINLAQRNQSEMLNFLEICLPLVSIKKESDYSFANLSKFLLGPANSSLSNSLIT